MSRTHTMRNIFASLAALACLCSGIIVFGAARHEAQAATLKSAYVTATMNKVSDGTGHGTSNQSFVNAQNGFDPGDNAPDDDVVSSGDYVVNNLSLSFTAAGARSVRVAWNIKDAPYLAGDTSFCYAGSQVKAELQSDGSCVFSIAAGVVENMNRTLFLVGKDTNGTAQPNNSAELIIERVAKDKQGEWVNDGQKTVIHTDPVTVVSAPAADLVIKDYGTTSPERNPNWMPDSGVSSYFDIEVQPLSYPGWSTHGASTKGDWWGKANVSEFPKETTWKIQSLDENGNPTGEVTDLGQADSNGQITLPKHSGNARLTWSLPADIQSKYAPESSGSKAYAWKIQLLPDKESFAADASQSGGAQRLLNLGTGSEPGNGEDYTYSTENKSLSSQKGYPYNNNDWSRGKVNALSPNAGPGIKALSRPYTSGKTVFEDANRLFDQAQRDAPASHQDGMDTVAVGTQVRVHLVVYTKRAQKEMPKPGASISAVDLWKPGEQLWDGSDYPQTQGVQVSQGNTVIDPSKYTVYWTDDTSLDETKAAKATPEQIENLRWHKGIPTQLNDKVRGIRVVMHDSADFEWGEGKSNIEVNFLVRANKPTQIDQDAHGDGTMTDFFRQDWTTVNDEHASDTSQEHIIVTQPRPIQTELFTQLKLVASDGTVRSGAGTPGDKVIVDIDGGTRKIDGKDVPQSIPVKNVALSGTKLHPEVRVPLPKGITEPESLSPEWNMKVETKADGSKELVFTPATADGAVTPSVSVLGTAGLDPIRWSGRVGLAASGKIDINANIAVIADANQAITSSSATAVAPAQDFTVSDDWLQGASLEPVTPLVEIKDAVAFKFDISARGTGREGTMTTVLRMPASGSDVAQGSSDDRAMRGKGCTPEASQEATDCKGLDGTWNQYSGGYSAYHGGTRMTKPVSLNNDESTSTDVWYAVDNKYSEDPQDFTWYTWDELVKKFGKAPKVTAIKLTSKFENPNLSNLDFGVAGAQGVITLDIPTDNSNQAGDKYTMWLGKARYSQDQPNGVAKPTVPFPAEARVVDSSIEGTLWWDQDRSTSINKDSQGNPTEELISGVKVSLYKLNTDGSKASDTPIATQLTDAQGHYKFTELHSGNYAVEVTRNECSDNAQTSCEVTGTTALPGVQTKSRTYYNQQLDVDTTRSWKAVGDATSDSSGMIGLPVSTAQKKVDFGYVKPDPKVTLNKTQQSLNCDDAKCVVNWDVVVENKGTEPIPAGTESVLNDRMSSLVQHVSTTVGVETEDTNKKVNFTQVDSGYDHTLALDEEGHVWGAGDNSQYELGDGTTVGITTPKRLIIDPTNPDLKFKQIAAGENHSFAIDEYGRLWGWGDNKSWRITGAPLEFNSKQTTQRQSDNSLIRWGDAGSINTPNDGSLAFLETPQLIQFTQNGQLVSDTNPAKDMKWRYITSKYNSTIAIDDQGHMWSWGSNWGDALGRGVSTSVLMGIGKVINVPDDEKFTTVHSGDAHSIALTENGHVWNFGFNEYGQLGREAVSLSGGGSNVPAQVQGVIAKDIAAGERAEYYIDTSGNVYSTGANGFGQLGLGYKDSSDETIGSRKKQFYKVDGVTADSIYASDANAVVITPSGDVYGWGSNLRGQLGTGATDPQLTPVKIFDKEYQITALSVSSALSRSHWALGGKVTASEGVTTIAAVTADGNGVGLGNNASGQLANGMKTDKQTTPIIMKGYVQPTTPPVDPTAQPTTPTSETTVGTEVTRTYTVPFTVNPGGRIVWHMQGTVMRTTAEQTAHNQAWFSSTLTPYATAPDTAAGRSQWEGVPSARGAQVTLPNVPNDANLNETMRDIIGNTVTGKDGKTYNVCLTGTDVNSVDKEHSFATNAEDSCDQVGLKINPYSTKPILGKISGVMWRDNDKNGVRDDGEPMIAGQKVYLLDQDGNEMPGYVTTTDANGHYEFTNLEVGTADQPKKYSVRFEPVYRSEFTKEDVNDSDPALDTSTDRDSDASTNPDTYGYATVYASLTDTHTEQDHLDAGVTPEKTWLAAMPHTGFGLWALAIVSVLLLAVMNMLALLLRKEH